VGVRRRPARITGGPGARAAPFSDTRYFFAWRPIAVSPISIRQFASSRGLHVLESELVVVWIPALLVCAPSFLMPRRSAKPW